MLENGWLHSVFFSRWNFRIAGALFRLAASEPRTPSPLPACGERSAPQAPGEGGSLRNSACSKSPHPLASLATSPRKRGEVIEFAALRVRHSSAGEHRPNITPP